VEDSLEIGARRLSPNLDGHVDETLRLRRVVGLGRGFAGHGWIVPMIEVRPDMAQALADFDELRKLASRFGFDLFEFLGSLVDRGLPVFSCDIDTSSAIAADYVISRYKLAKEPEGVLLTLRARDRARGNADAVVP
jgi:hypothetical protein